MNDIAKCAGIDCPIREHCKRYTMPGGDQQNWHNWKYDKLTGCDAFKENNTR